MWNVFEQIQKMKKNLVCSVQYVHSNPNNILLLTSRGFASKVQTLFLTLKLLNSKDCKKAALSKTQKRAARGWGLTLIKKEESTNSAISYFLVLYSPTIQTGPLL